MESINEIDKVRLSLDKAMQELIYLRSELGKTEYIQIQRIREKYLIEKGIMKKHTRPDEDYSDYEQKRERQACRCRELEDLRIPLLEKELEALINTTDKQN